MRGVYGDVVLCPQVSEDLRHLIDYGVAVTPPPSGSSRRDQVTPGRASRRAIAASILAANLPTMVRRVTGSISKSFPAERPGADAKSQPQYRRE